MAQRPVRRRHRRTARLVACFACLAIAGGTLLPALAASDAVSHDHGSAAAAPQGTGPAAETSGEQIEEQWGVKLVGLRHTAAGYMLDLRFRVLDPEKAAPLLSRNIDRYVVVEKSGAVLRVPSTEKLGMLRSAVSSPDMVKKDRVYAALFANPGRHVRPGDKVTLVLGDFKKPVRVE